MPQTGDKKMLNQDQIKKAIESCKKYTLEQLQRSLIELRKRTDNDGFRAYQMTFEVVCDRMGEDAFLDWTDGLGW